MPQLLNLIKEITTDMPRNLTDQRAIYIKSRNITSGVNARIVDKGDQLGAGWHRLAYIQDIQIHAYEADWTPEGEIENLKVKGLSEDSDNKEILKRVITAKETSELFGVKEDTVRAACQNNLVLARQSGSIWLLPFEAAEERWGKHS